MQGQLRADQQRKKAWLYRPDPEEGPQLKIATAQVPPLRRGREALHASADPNERRSRKGVLLSTGVRAPSPPRHTAAEQGTGPPPQLPLHPRGRGRRPCEAIVAVSPRRAALPGLGKGLLHAGRGDVGHMELDHGTGHLVLRSFPGHSVRVTFRLCA